MKSTFTDDIRMERLISTLEGEAASAVKAIGTSGLFYASALKTLKRDFGNPAVVSHMKLKELLEETDNEKRKLLLNKKKAPKTKQTKKTKGAPTKKNSYKASQNPTNQSLRLAPRRSSES